MTTTENTARTHTINAAGKRLGIIATEAASVLMGKDQATFSTICFAKCHRHH